MRVLLIDNYDSFTWNLAQYLEELGVDLTVRLNDALSVDEAMALGADAVMISPGPGRPEESGITLEVVRRCAGSTPLLGVCLGHQAIAQSYGAEIVQAPTLMHGKTSPIEHDGEGLFAGLSNPFDATRYHSLVVDPPTLPDSLVVTATTPEGVIMGLRHRSLPLWGVQFHPESILTPAGKPLLGNFLSLVRQALVA
ncbi:MAG: aminodeoxychorismate/anthranilate synthase component II [Acidobacteriota bacterium]